MVGLAVTFVGSPLAWSFSGRALLLIALMAFGIGYLFGIVNCIADWEYHWEQWAKDHERLRAANPIKAPPLVHVERIGGIEAMVLENADAFPDWSVTPKGDPFDIEATDWRREP